MISLFVSKEDFVRKLAQIENSKKTSELEIPEGVVSASRGSIGSLSDEDIRKLENDLKAQTKALLKQYVSASDLHGLIHEVWFISIFTFNPQIPDMLMICNDKIPYDIICLVNLINNRVFSHFNSAAQSASKTIEPAVFSVTLKRFFRKFENHVHSYSFLLFPMAKYFFVIRLAFFSYCSKLVYQSSFVKKVRNLTNFRDILRLVAQRLVDSQMIEIINQSSTKVIRIS